MGGLVEEVVGVQDLRQQAALVDCCWVVQAYFLAELDALLDELDIANGLVECIFDCLGDAELHQVGGVLREDIEDAGERLDRHDYRLPRDLRLISFEISSMITGCFNTCTSFWQKGSVGKRARDFSSATLRATRSWETPS